MKNRFRVFPKMFGFFPYIFLIYLFMPAVYISQETGMKMVFGFGLLLLFLVSYRQLYWQGQVETGLTIWLAIQIIIMVILSIWYNPYHLFMGFFSAYFIGWYKNKAHFYLALTGFAAALFIGMVAAFFQDSIERMLFFIPFLLVMVISPFGIRSMNRSMELEKQLDQANEQIKELVKREERIRIARDLHDTLGHTLSLITLQSQLVQRFAENDAVLQAKAKAKEIETTSRSALRQVRELVSGMRSISIEEELANMKHIIQAAGMSYVCEGEQNLSDIPLLQQNILGMCLREAGTNIVKHSQAKNCRIRIEKRRECFMITISDDGQGLGQQLNEGNGLRGMKERLALIEGELVIDHKNGTTLTMKVPIVKIQGKEGTA
ncbi:sensor histidine kinase [Siminovitchia fortis]|uniref:histidine kinase n=1 Tax=Siminovitchia fortis TaxID=254758 RepID=A0A443INX7_9BACI|nr:sensor histidine kinase [Siminovitchia fortis]RWR07295.1 sensor histidine kinase [Siminovitchia fortis]WHY81518.1 sensor histidine kinase [Siminovitchia fortis]